MDTNPGDDDRDGITEEEALIIAEKIAALEKQELLPTELESVVFTASVTTLWRNVRQGINEWAGVSVGRPSTSVFEQALRLSGKTMALNIDKARDPGIDKETRRCAIRVGILTAKIAEGREITAADYGKAFDEVSSAVSKVRLRKSGQDHPHGIGDGFGC